MAEKITVEELKRRMEEKGDFIIVNVLNRDEFENGHIPGSINIPLEEDFEEQAKQILTDKDQEIVVHCSSFRCEASSDAAERLEGLGYENVVELQEGINEWEDRDFPVESNR